MNAKELKDKLDEYRYITDEKEALEAVKENGYALRFVKNQTLEICLEAVKQNGDALRYVNNQTLEICLEAVKQDGDALRYVNIDIEIPQTLEDRVKELEDIINLMDRII